MDIAINLFRYGAREDVASISSDVMETASFLTASEIEVKRLLNKRSSK